MNTPLSPRHTPVAGADGAAPEERMTADDPVQALRSHSSSAMRQLADDAAGVARSGIDAARHRAVTLRDSGSEYIRIHPLQAVLIAAGAGALLVLVAGLLRPRGGPRG